MTNRDKSAVEQMEELKKQLKEFIDITLKLVRPIVMWLLRLTESIKKIFKQLFKDKKNKKNNKRLHRIKRKIMRR